MKRFVLSIALTTLAFIIGLAQESNEDVVLTNDGTILRGTIIEKFSPGVTFTIRSANNRFSVTFRSEIVAGRTLPMGIPDSVITGSFDYHEVTDKEGHTVRVYDAPRRAPKLDFTGYEKEEDVLFLEDGSIRRGVLLHQRNNGVFSMWNSGSWSQVPGSDVVKSVRVERGIPDSILVNTYLRVPEEWRAGEFRIFSIHGGLSIPLGTLSTPVQVGRGAAKLGGAFGIEAGIRLWPGFRWLTSATYSMLPRDVAVFFIDAPSNGNASPLNLIQFMTGVEGRTFSSSDFRFRFAALAGVVSMNAGGYTATFPRASHRLAGTASVDGISSSSFGLRFSTGLLAGRFSLDVAWTDFRPDYTSRTDIIFENGSAGQISSAAGESNGLLTVVIGFSIL